MIIFKYRDKTAWGGKTMKSINLFLVTRNKALELCSEYENVVSGREKRLKIKEHEYKSLCSLVEELGKCQLKISDVDGFHFSFSISQISKEFDLLKIKKDRKVLNIELKSEMIDEAQIKKQLVRNQYYLKHIATKIESFTYVVDKKQFFTLNNDKLVECSISKLVDTLKNFTEYDEEIDQLFSAKDYLISPLNTPQKFLDGQYFLTDAQERIKQNIITNLQEKRFRNFWGITGRAGTGKTLLLYDLARELTKIGKVCIIHCGILCDGHIYLQQNINNLDVIDAKSINKHNLKKYRFILLDETQRIYKESFETISNLITENNIVGVFSYDDFQTLSKSEENNKIVDKIKALSGFKEEKLKTRIRTNEEMAAFIGKLLNLNAIPNKSFKYEKIDIICANSIKEARKIINYYRQQKDYVFIEYTKSLYSSGSIDAYHGDINTHKVIGQEYDNVIIVLDDNFLYSSEGRLMAREHPYSNYLFYKLFFQGVSRAREKLCIVVVDNPDLFKKVLDIKYDAIQ